MKLLGMDVKQNMGIRMDGTVFDDFWLCTILSNCSNILIVTLGPTRGRAYSQGITKGKGNQSLPLTQDKDRAYKHR